jgi:hypothetical protein
VLAGCVLLAVIQTGIATDIGRAMYGGGGDPGQDAWILHWVSGHLLGDPRRLFEGNNYYPSHHAVLYCDPLLGPAALVLPLRLLTGNPVLLYNAAMLLSLVLAGYGFYRLGLELVGDRRAALLAAVVIPYTSQQMTRLFHLNLLAIGFFPLLWIALRRLLARPGPLPALGAGLAFALQAGTSGYHAFSVLVLAALLVALEVPRLRDRKVLLSLALAAAVAALALAPYVLGFLDLRAAEARMTRDPEAHRALSLDLATGLLAGRSYLWRPLLRRDAMPFFPGLAVVAFAAVGLWRGERRLVLRLVAIAVVFYALALGPEVRVFGHEIAPGPFRLLAAAIPLIEAMRHPLTFGVPAVMALGLLAVEGLHRSGLTRSPLATALVLAFAVAEVLGPCPARVTADQELPEIYRVLQRAPAGATLELPFCADASGDPNATPDGRWRWWSIFHERAIVNGAGAFEPERFTLLCQFVSREWKGPPRDREEERAVQLLKRRFPIRYLLLHAEAPQAMRGSVEATTRTFRLLQQTAAGDRLYEVDRGGAGPHLVRAFREDQLAEATVAATLRGAPGQVVEVRWNGETVARETLHAGDNPCEWRLPRQRIRRGLGELDLVDPGGGVFTLADLQPR